MSALRAAISANTLVPNAFNGAMSYGHQPAYNRVLFQTQQSQEKASTPNAFSDFPSSLITTAPDLSKEEKNSYDEQLSFELLKSTAQNNNDHQNYTQLRPTQPKNPVKCKSRKQKHASNEENATSLIENALASSPSVESPTSVRSETSGSSTPRGKSSSPSSNGKCKRSRKSTESSVNENLDAPSAKLNKSLEGKQVQPVSPGDEPKVKDPDDLKSPRQLLQND